MIEQYLLNKNKSVIVAKFKIFSEPNKAQVFVHGRVKPDLTWQAVPASSSLCLLALSPPARTNLVVLAAAGMYGTAQREVFFSFPK